MMRRFVRFNPKSEVNDREKVKRENPEYHLQVWYVLYLKSLGVLHCATCGGMRTFRKVMAKMKRMGYKPGYPDVIIDEPRGKWHGMRVELKCGSYPTDYQLLWQSLLMARGIYAIIVPGRFTYQEAQKYLEDETTKYLNGEA